MGEEKGLTHLQEILRSLCFKTQWKYAVFWRLKRRDRMILTWEEAYYANHGPTDPSDHIPSESTFEIFNDGRYFPDPLGFAVAKMSHIVYSLGEGIIGQVALTGKHQWLFVDKPMSHIFSLNDCCDGWKSQFSAGIRTIAIVAVVPHGVVQLGSPHMITEDVELVNHIKDVFHSLQDSSMESIIPNLSLYSMQSSLYLSQVSSQETGLEIFNDIPPTSNKASSNKAQNLSHSLPPLGICNNLSSNVLPLDGLHQNNSCEVFNKYLIFEPTKCGNDGTVKLHQHRSTILRLESEQQKQVQMNILSNQQCGEENSRWSDIFIDSNHNDAPASYIFPMDNMYSYHSIQQFDEKLDANYNSEVIGSAKVDSTTQTHLQIKELEDQMKLQLGKVLEPELETEVSCVDAASSSSNYPVGCNLYEAFETPVKKEQGNSPWNLSEKSEAVVQNEAPIKFGNSHLTTEYGSKCYLGAMMRNMGSASHNVKRKRSLCTSRESLLTTGTKSETSHHCTSLDGGVFTHSCGIMEYGTNHHLKSVRNSKEVFIEMCSTGSSFTTQSDIIEHSELHLEPAKVVRKRSRPHQSCRPQPRDRQLIQNRVKELRDLVPNGSKCSIISLLERAVEHMLLLQNVTKRTNKKENCATSKFYGKKMGQQNSPSHEHGSSWVVEVGRETEACPIVIENLNINGLMIVEMCEEGSHFLDIAETLRSLGLSIVKGATEVRGGKTWASFVVEGQNERCIHRMDILWALMLLLQSKRNI